MIFRPYTNSFCLHKFGLDVLMCVASRMENLLSLYSRAHVGFCKRCCPTAENPGMVSSNWVGYIVCNRH